MDKIKYLSQNFLLKILTSPWGFSFLPSKFLWNENYSFTDYKEQILTLDTSFSNNLYIHIPYCTKICDYCNCYKIKLSKWASIEKYVDDLIKQISLFEGKNITLDSIFIWWWTANLLENKDLIRLFKKIKNTFSFSWKIQILIDGHPNYFTKDKIDLYKKLWFTRVTFAIQSLNFNVLDINNRDRYFLDEMFDLINYTRKIWITVNVDLMVWLRWQTISDIIRDINFLRFKVDNISIHYLMLSDNFSYDLPSNYLEICQKVKEYLKKNPIKNIDENKQESLYSKGRSNVIWIGAESVSSFVWGSTFKMMNVKLYSNFLDWKSLIFWKKLTLWDEIFRYILLNCKPYIDIKIIYNIFWINILQSYNKWLLYLLKNKIITVKDHKIYPIVSDLEYFIWLMIFSFNDFSQLNNLEKDADKFLKNYFDLQWNLIDE
jgi:oxygen-independent coproporphyrinogen-3 oxidase